MSDKQDEQQESHEPVAAAESVAGAEPDTGSGPSGAPATAASKPVDRDRDGGGQRSGGIAWLALLLALGLAAGAGWFFMEVHKREASLAERLQAVEATAATLTESTGQLASTTATLSSRTDAIASETDSLRARAEASARPEGASGAAADIDLEALDARWDERMQAAVDAAVDDLRSGVARQSQQMQELEAELSSMGAGPEVDIHRGKWLLAEVEYLLRLANQRLIMTGDVTSAEALLTSADSILRDLNDVGLLEVRRAIASDLATLRAMPQLDIEGSYVRLAALIEQVDELVIFELPEPPEAAIIEPDPEEGWQASLRRGYQQAMAKLASYVVVRRRETPAEALMDPQWERLVRQNLRMLLEQAQIALLSGNQVLYRESLQRSQHWVREFFESDQSGAELMNREINELMQQTIEVELPDISESMQALDAAVSQRLAPAPQDAG